MRNEGGRKKPTPRRIEPKSTFGIYIPADIPKEACDFLNLLKDNGTFSTDVVEIVVQYLEVRKFLNPEDPLHHVTGNVLDQIKDRIVLSQQLVSSEDEPELLLGTATTAAEEPAFAQTPVDSDNTLVEETSKTPDHSTAGFDLNKVLQRMRRNKSIGSVNQIKNT